MDRWNPVESCHTKKIRHNVPFFTFPLFETQEWLAHGISTRSILKKGEPTDFNLGYTPYHDRGIVDDNRRLFLEAIAAGDFAMPPMRQIHSDRVALIHAGPASAPEAISRDGSITGERKILLPVVTADCAAVIFADPGHRAVGAVHAGWRGALQSIIPGTVDLLQEVLGTNPARLLAAIGPCLGPCCFEIGEDVAEQFRQAFPQFPEMISEAAGRKLVLNLALLLYRQLREKGLCHENITSLPLCTNCHGSLFYSYRREGEGTGRILAGIGIR